MGLFINLKIDQSAFPTLEARQKLAGVCPVDAFVADESGLHAHPENEDECTFCGLCLRKAPQGSLQVVKSYEEWLTKA